MLDSLSMLQIQNGTLQKWKGDKIPWRQQLIRQWFGLSIHYKVEEPLHSGLSWVMYHGPLSAPAAQQLRTMNHSPLLLLPNNYSA